MYTLTAENSAGKKLTLTQNKDYTITSITGLNPPTATLNAVAVAGYDGEQYNSGRVNPRNIVINIVINNDIAVNRLRLYEIFHIKQYIKLYFNNDLRDVFIEGRIETIECDLFAMRQTMQISIICYQPYFCDTSSYSALTHTVDMLEFPVEFPADGIVFSEYSDVENLVVVNAGEVVTGMIIKFRATGGDVYKPALYNVDTKEKLALTITDFPAGSEMIINTNKGERSITLIKDGITSNAINYLDSGSTWLQLNLGRNTFTYDTWLGNEFLEIEIISNNKFQGV